MLMGALTRYSTLLAITFSLGGSVSFVACGGSDTANNQTPDQDSGTGGTPGTGGAGIGGSTGGTGTGGAATGGAATGGTDSGAADGDAADVVSNGDAADGAG